jgi:hypothetical protein
MVEELNNGCPLAYVVRKKMYYFWQEAGTVA